MSPVSLAYILIWVLQCLVITVESPLSCEVENEVEVGEEKAHYDDTTPDNYFVIGSLH